MAENEERVYLVFKGGPHDGRTGWVKAAAGEPGAVVDWPASSIKADSVRTQYRITDFGLEVDGVPRTVAEFVGEAPPSGS